MTTASICRATHRMSVIPLHADVSMRAGWIAFHRMARISRFSAATLLADLNYERRMAYWYALSCMDAVDWLAIRATLRTSDNALSRAYAFRNTHAY